MLSTERSTASLISRARAARSAGVAAEGEAVVEAFVPGGGAGGVHAFADAAVEAEVFFLGGEHLVEEVAGLLAEGRHEVGGGVGGAGGRQFPQ